jgi:hypothetical protein
MGREDALLEALGIDLDRDQPGAAGVFSSFFAALGSGGELPRRGPPLHSLFGSNGDFVSQARVTKKTRAWRRWRRFTR